MVSRREWFHGLGITAAAASSLSALASRPRSARRFHVCLSPAIVERDPELLTSVRQAGVEAVWLAGYFYGHRPFGDDLIRRARARLEKAGLESELITVPIGHPGDSLGAHEGDFPLTPPRHWQTGQRPDGQEYAGTSLHAPATEENAAALRHLRTFGFRRGFLDDDFRLARGPGEIGGCFCAAHRAQFLRVFGYAPRCWEGLCEDVQARRLTPLLRAWLDFTCDELTGSFRAQRRAFRGDLGIMVMYLGAEKAGIRLGDYRRALFRVGELMFDDDSFGPVKGKTDELFSALFHRRFASPDRAFSETTAFPAARLSARNMAAKLVISTLADVRHTMLMSGLTPFPLEHWAVLGPAMRDQTRLHEAVAGHRPRGPFKHFWGDAQRLVGSDQPFSLWLAAGVPFEVVEGLPSDGWTFLSDFDAREMGDRGEEGRGTRLVCRAASARCLVGGEAVAESLPDLFAFKNRIRDKLGRVPHVVEAEPAVCAWYPTAGKVVVWNLAEQPRTLTVACGERHRELRLGGLEAASIPV